MFKLSELIIENNINNIINQPYQYLYIKQHSRKPMLFLIIKLLVLTLNQFDIYLSYKA
jgi:hypothetical protein